MVGIHTKPREGTMKLLVSAIALLIGSNVAAMAGDQALKFKLVTFYAGEKDGVSHSVGVTIAPDGTTLGTKDFTTKDGPDGKGTGHSTYNFQGGSVTADFVYGVDGNATGGKVQGTYKILSGTGEYLGATGTGAFSGKWGDMSPLKGAGLYNVELDVRTPGS
jgi:hypothetical protein